MGVSDRAAFDPDGRSVSRSADGGPAGAVAADELRATDGRVVRVHEPAARVNSRTPGGCDRGAAGRHDGVSSPRPAARGSGTGGPKGVPGPGRDAENADPFLPTGAADVTDDAAGVSEP